MSTLILRVVDGGEAPDRRSPLWDAYDWFRTEKQGNAVSPATLAYYDNQVKPLIEWLEAEHPEVRR